MLEFLMTFLLNTFWQSALVILAAIIGTWLLRDAGSRLKHVIWVAALVVSLTLPLLTGWFSAPDMTARGETTVVSELHFEWAGRVLFEPSVSDAPVAPIVPGTIPISAGLAFGILVLYGLFVIYRAGALVHALLRTSAIRRRSYCRELPENILVAINQCSSALSARKPHVFFSGEVPVPVTVGWLRPLIILPESFLLETDSNVLATAIGHELVHVTRRDYAVNLLFEIVSLPISFHPAVAYAKRRIAQMRELCCDEVVASRLLNADIYARSLLNIAGSASPQNRLSPMITVGITDNTNLEVRIMSLLKRPKMSLGKKSILLGAAVVFLAVPVAVAAFFSPSVNVTSASVEPEPQPTVPTEMVIELDPNKTNRAELEKDLLKIKMALAEANLTPESEAELKQRAWKVESRLAMIDQVFRVERLTRQLSEVATTLNDPNLSEEKKNVFHTMESKLKNELHDVGSVRESGPPAAIEIDIEVPADGYEWDHLPNRDKDSPGYRQAMEKLKKAASISMEQAMQLALASHPGEPVEKELGSVKGEVTYRFFIRDSAATPKSNVLMVDVSGIGGRIIKTARAHVTVTKRDGGDKVREIEIPKPE